MFVKYQLRLKRGKVGEYIHRLENLIPGGRLAASPLKLSFRSDALTRPHPSLIKLNSPTPPPLPPPPSILPPCPPPPPPPPPRETYGSRAESRYISKERETADYPTINIKDYRRLLKNALSD